MRSEAAVAAEASCVVARVWGGCRRTLGARYSGDWSRKQILAGCPWHVMAFSIANATVAVATYANVALVASFWSEDWTVERATSSAPIGSLTSL